MSVLISNNLLKW